jgi:hypothetical protein
MRPVLVSARTPGRPEENAVRHLTIPMPPLSSPSSRFPSALTALIGLLLALSLILILWGSNKGFDLTDEGTYMLLSSYPDQYPSNWTGFHILISSIQSVIPVSIINVRLLRLTITLLANIAFATAFLAWLDSYFSGSHKTLQRFKPFLFLLLLSSTLMPYTLLPQTPGYNDVAGIFGLLAVACILLALRPKTASPPQTSRSGLIGLSGFLLVFAAFGKWSSGLAQFLLFITVIPLSLPGPSLRSIVHAAICFFAGISLGLATIHFGIINLVTFCQGLKAAILLAANHEHPPAQMLFSYAKEMLNLFLIPLKYGWWGIVLTILFSWRVSKNKTETLPLFDKVIFAAIIVNLAYYSIHKDLFLGSNAYVQTSVRAYVLIAILLLAFWTTRQVCAPVSQTPPILPSSLEQPIASWRKISGPLLMLFLLPLGIAAGTIGSLFSVGVYVFASWMAILIILACYATRYRLGNVLSLFLLLAAFALMESQFVTGYLFRPYRLPSPLFKQTERVPGLSKGEGLGFDAPTAKFLSELNHLYRAANPAEDQPLIGIYNLPGLVYLLGGVSPGPVWYQDANGAGSVHLIPQLWSSTENNAQTRSHSPKPFLLLPETLRPEVQEVLLARLAYPAAYKLVGSVQSPYEGNVLALWIPLDR